MCGGGRRPAKACFVVGRVTPAWQSQKPGDVDMCRIMEPVTKPEGALMHELEQLRQQVTELFFCWLVLLLAAGE